MKTYFVLMGGICALGTLFSSCAHTMRSTVAMKINEEEAHIGLGSQEVKEGDRVVIFRNICGRTKPGVKGSVYEKVKIGQATVEKVLNDQYSIAKMDPGILFQEGDVVEKG